MTVNYQNLLDTFRIINMQEETKFSQQQFEKKCKTFSGLNEIKSSLNNPIYGNVDRLENTMQIKIDNQV